MNLHRTILFVHCGEPEAQAFCDDLRSRLAHLFSRFSGVCVNCATGEVEAIPRSRPTPRELVKYIGVFDVSIERYDRELARLAELERVRIPLTVFCVTRTSLGSRQFRNLFVHHTDASGLLPAVHSLPVLFATDYEEVSFRQACVN